MTATTTTRPEVRLQATSRQSTSVIATLRAVMPRRPMRWHELERIAELQANRLLELARLSAPPVPIEIISGLPRLQVQHVVDLPVGGTADWVGGQWLLSIAAGDGEPRQRYSIAHEFKHVLDHPFRDVIFTGTANVSPQDQAERLAEYFAACLLMPKKWVVRCWGTGTQRLTDLSQRFEVSARAMQIRLWQLGLAEPARRCAVADTRPTTRARRA